MKSKFTIAKTLIMACIICLSSVIGAQASKNIDDFIVAVPKLPPTLEPMRENSNMAIRIFYNVFETLIKPDLNKGYGLIPGLATSWERVDAKTLDVNLRHGVTFHNGEPLTVDDVVFTFGEQRFRSEDAPGWGVVKQFLGGLVDVQAIDEDTVRFTFEKSDFLLEYRLAGAWAGIINKKAYLQAGDWDKWSAKPVGTGAYLINEFKPNQHLKLDRFEGYWGEKAPVSTLTFKVVPELAARMAGVRSGEFNIITEVTPDQVSTLKRQDIRITGGPIGNIYAIIYDVTNETLKDPRIRQALNLAIDRELIVETLYGGLTEVPQGWQMKSFGDMFLEDQPKPEFNPEKAKKLLKEAGYKGEKIQYRILNNYYTLERPISQALVSMWRNVGLNVYISVKENWAQVVENTPERMVRNASFTAFYPDPVGQFWRRFSPSSGWMAQDYFKMSDRFQELGFQLEAETDVQKRRTIFKEMLDIFDADPKGTPLLQLVMLYGLGDGFEWSAGPSQVMDLTATGLKITK